MSDEWVEDDAQDQGAGGNESEDADAESTDESQEPAEESKRISDLMSKWQKAEAAKVKLEGELKALREQGPAPSGGEAALWIEVMREAARDQVYASDPRFAKYKLDSGLIDGTTPEQMRQSAKRLATILDQVEADAQQSVLKKHGLSPEQRGGAVQRMPDFTQMSDDDFAKAVAKAKGH